MNLLGFRRGGPSTALPPAIYVALVHSLFQNYLASFAGTVCAAVAALLTAWKTGTVLLWPCAIFIIAVGAARAYDMYAYESSKSQLTPESAVQWERRYRTGAVLYASALGIWCWTTLLQNDDPVAQLLCLSVTIGYVAAGAGRNYGRPSIAHQQVFYACGPMCLALFLHGGVYYISLALLNALFFVALKRITLDLHQVHVRALIAGETIASIANQFDTALNNMPHGLCMLDGDGRLAVMNQRFRAMMNLPDDLVQRGAGASDIISACVNAGSISGASGNMILSEIENSQARDIITTDPDAARGRSLAWTFQPMAGGGAVVLVEDVTERRNAEARITH